MNLKTNAISKSILILIVCTVVGWTCIGVAAEQWDARATTRVNLRTRPGSSGVILSVVPVGQRVRILEIKGPWCRVDVEGKLHGKGWIYGEYLEGFAQNGIEAEPLLQPESDEESAKETMHRLNPAAASSDAPTKDIAVKQAGVSPAAKILEFPQNEQAVPQKILPKSKSDTDPQPQIKSSEKPAPAQVASQAAPPKLPKAVEKSEPQDTANSEKDSESDLQQAVSMLANGRPLQTDQLDRSLKDLAKDSESKPSGYAQPNETGGTADVSGKHFRTSSAVIEQPNEAPNLKKLPSAEKKQIATAANTSATTGAKVETETHAGAPSVGLTTSPFRRTKP
ncbi:MAG: SH3 domain-containing protein, partial [Desulfobacterales bacterium]